MLSFSRTSSGVIKVTDASDGSVATISNKSSEVLISADSKTGNIEIRSTGFYKSFNFDSVQYINNSVPANKTLDSIVDTLSSAIFISAQVTQLPQQQVAQSSTSLSVTLTAGQNISVGQIVTIGFDGKAYIYDISNESNALREIGIATQSAAINGSINAVMNGVATISGMNWLAGEIYFAGPTGFPSLQVPTPPGILRIVGTGINGNSMKLGNGISIVTQ